MIPLFIDILFSFILIPELHYYKAGEPVPASSIIIRYGDYAYTTDKILKMSPGLFSIMDFELISGFNSKQGYPEGILLPLKTKLRIFGDNPALGKTIYVDSQPLEVVGLIKDIPENSRLFCDLVILWSELELSVEELTNIKCLIIN